MELKKYNGEYLSPIPREEWSNFSTNFVWDTTISDDDCFADEIIRPMFYSLLHRPDDWQLSVINSSNDAKELLNSKKKLKRLCKEFNKLCNKLTNQVSLTYELATEKEYWTLVDESSYADASDSTPNSIKTPLTPQQIEEFKSDSVGLDTYEEMCSHLGISIEVYWYEAISIIVIHTFDSHKWESMQVINNPDE